MKFSVIVVSLNAGEKLLQTVDSILTQTYDDFEIIVKDGMSKDGSVEQLPEDPRIVLEKRGDKGIYDAMNKGIAHATGELIGIVNAGDFYEPEILSHVANAYQAHPQAGVFYGNMNMLNSDGSLFKTKNPDTDISHLSKGFGLYHPTFFVTRKTYDSVGTYTISFHIAADYDFAFRAYRRGVMFCYVNAVLSNFPIDGVSSKSRKACLEESKLVLLTNGVTEQEVKQTYAEWLRHERRNDVLRWGYNGLQKIIPLSLLNRLANHIHA